jgi:hypothetical protein
LSFSSLPRTSTMYSVGISGCNPYINWYGVYFVATLYAFFYEKITLWTNVRKPLVSKGALFMLFCNV